jgi:hypothetical protein
LTLLHESTIEPMQANRLTDKCGEMRMRSRFYLIGAAMALLALIAFGSVQSGVRASNPDQAATATVDATTGTGGGIATGVTYPACPATSTIATATADATTGAGGTGGTTGTATPAATTGAGGTGGTTGTATADATTGAGGTGGTTGTATAVGSPAANTGGYLGVEVTTVELCGIRVVRLLADSPAATAGVLAGDVIVAVDDVALATLFGDGTGSGISPTVSATQDLGGTNVTPVAGATLSGTATGSNPFLSQVFFQEIQRRTPGETVRLTVQRGGQQLTLTVTLGTIPPGLVTPIGGTDTAGAGGQATPVTTATP